MQKTFTKYIIIILTAAISLILFLNFLINLHTLESRQYDTFYDQNGSNDTHAGK